MRVGAPKEIKNAATVAMAAAVVTAAVAVEADIMAMAVITINRYIFVAFWWSTSVYAPGQLFGFVLS
ncbi:MAG: hypothetical protein ABSD21_04540 [Rhizomicrobium sp.]|jgi:hypothetical protein